MLAFRAIILLTILSLFSLALAAQEAYDVTLQPAPRPMPAAVLTQGDLRLELSSLSIKQGGAALLRLTGGDIRWARLNFLGEERDFFPLDGAWYAILLAGMDTHPRDHDLRVTVGANEDTTTFLREMPIEKARYIVQQVQLPAERAKLVDPDIEREEFDLLTQITARHDETPLWDAAGFGLPMESDITTPYGAFRIMNDIGESRHTGWDQQASTGMTVQAMAAGEAVFAGNLELRGHTVILNHGLGIFTLYAHLSEIHVSMGDAVSAAQILGLSGNSGRSSAPHLHWEVIIGGQWVDGLEFIKLWLPSPSPPQTPFPRK